MKDDGITHAMIAAGSAVEDRANVVAVFKAMRAASGEAVPWCHVVKYQENGWEFAPDEDPDAIDALLADPDYQVITLYAWPSARADVADLADARRYRWLRSRDPGPDGAPTPAGPFIGVVPANLIVTEADADQAIDAAMAAGGPA